MAARRPCSRAKMASQRSCKAAKASPILSAIAPHPFVVFVAGGLAGLPSALVRGLHVMEPVRRAIALPARTLEVLVPRLSAAQHPEKHLREALPHPKSRERMVHYSLHVSTGVATAARLATGVMPRYRPSRLLGAWLARNTMPSGTVWHPASRCGKGVPWVSRETGP